MSIELTPIAANEIRRLLLEHELDGQTQVLRVGVKGFGPNRQFTLDFGERDPVRETVVESQGIRISFDPSDASKLDGVTIHFRDVGGARGFTFDRPSTDVSRRERASGAGHSPPDESQVRQALRAVIDPEVGINIVDLGLVYGVTIAGRSVRVTMTMTTPACPLGEHIRSEVHTHVLGQCAGAEQVDVEIVWEPAWSSDKITAEGKRALGWSQ